jgi:hypothetical protein
MRDYGKVYTAFWTDPSVRSLSEDGRTLFLYLLTCPHGNSIGLFRLPDAYAADDMQWSIERVSKGFQNLVEHKLCSRETVSAWVVLPKYVRWNGFENPNVATGAQKAFDAAPDCEPKALCAKALLEYGAHLSAEFRNRLETVAKRSRNPEPKPEPEPEPKPEPQPFSEVVGSLSLSDPATKKSSAKLPTKTADIWAAYAGAYLNRYNTEPVRNAKVNAMLAQVVARIGADEAPHVAAWYVTSNRALYVSAKHCADLLVRDCEGLRTEWATGRSVTDTAARQADSKQTNLNVAETLIAELRNQA